MFRVPSSASFTVEGIQGQSSVEVIWDKAYSGSAEVSETEIARINAAAHGNCRRVTAEDLLILLLSACTPVGERTAGPGVALAIRTGYRQNSERLKFVIARPSAGPWQSREGTADANQLPIKWYAPIASVAALSERHADRQYLQHRFYGTRPPDLSLQEGAAIRTEVSFMKKAIPILLVVFLCLLVAFSAVCEYRQQHPVPEGCWFRLRVTESVGSRMQRERRWSAKVRITAEICRS